MATNYPTAVHIQPFIWSVKLRLSLLMLFLRVYILQPPPACCSYPEPPSAAASWGRTRPAERPPRRRPAASAPPPGGASLPPAGPHRPAGAAAWRWRWGSFWGGGLGSWRDRSRPETARQGETRRSFSSAIFNQGGELKKHNSAPGRNCWIQSFSNRGAWPSGGSPGANSELFYRQISAPGQMLQPVGTF